MTRLTTLSIAVGLAIVGVAPAHTRIDTPPTVKAVPSAFEPDMAFDLEPLPEGELAALRFQVAETESDDEPAEAFQPASHKTKRPKSQEHAPAKKKSPVRTDVPHVSPGGETALAKQSSGATGLVTTPTDANGRSFIMNRQTGSMWAVLNTWHWEGSPVVYTSSAAAWKNQPAACSARHRAAVCAQLKHSQMVVGDALPDDVRAAKEQWAQERRAHKIQ